MCPPHGIAACTVRSAVLSPALERQRKCGAAWSRGRPVPGLRRRNPGYKEDGLSNAQCEQLNHPDSDHQYRERDGIVIEPIFPVCTHDMPPLYALLLVGAGRQMVQIGRTIFLGGYSALNPCPHSGRASRASPGEREPESSKPKHFVRSLRPAFTGSLCRAVHSALMSAPFTIGHHFSISAL
jgi:hypothetical protein